MIITLNKKFRYKRPGPPPFLAFEFKSSKKMAANGWLGRNHLKSFLSMLINQGFFALLINSRLRKLKIARVCKIRDVSSQITAELCILARLNDN